MLKNIFSDPLLIKAYSSTLSPDGQKLHVRAISWSIAAGILEGFSLGLIVPTISGLAGPDAFEGVRWWLALMGVLALIAIGVFLQQQRSAYMTAIDILTNLHEKIGNKLASLPMGWFGPRVSGTISRLSTDGIMSIGGGIAHGECELIRTITALVTTNLVIVIWQPRLGLVLFCGALLVAFFVYISRILRDRGHRLNVDDRDEVSRRIVEFASCQPALRAAGRADNYEPLEKALVADKKSSITKLYLDIVALILSNLANQLTVVALILIATTLWASDQLHPVALIAFLGVCLRFNVLLGQFVEHFISADLVRSPVSNVQEILDAEVLPEPEPDKVLELTAPGRVEFEDVSFGYQEDSPVLRNINFTAAPGSLTAIVGPSGSGKTTLFRLICRFWDTNAGAVKVGGLDVRDQSSAQLMSQIAMVFQDPYLFEDTLAANIAVGTASAGYSVPEATQDDVRAAADMTGVSDIAQRLPGGWDCTVGSGGRKLSGGERQRVSIARALVKKAPIVLFDEATSALDPENELRIQESINALRKHSTVLIIAHNLNTVMSADQIVVLDAHGNIESTGAHTDLLERSAIYASFWKSRQGATGWSLTH